METMRCGFAAKKWFIDVGSLIYNATASRLLGASIHALDSADDWRWLYNPRFHLGLLIFYPFRVIFLNRYLVNRCLSKLVR